MSARFLREGGAPLDGHFAPADAPHAPAILVLHEWWGLTPHIRGVVDRFAAAGFDAFAPDFYHGKVATTEERAERLMQALDAQPAEAMAFLARSARALLAQRPGARLGVVGFCAGGAWAVKAAAEIDAIEACVTFYGIDDEADAGAMRCRVLGHFATEDRWVSPARVGAFAARLTAAGVAHEFHRYDARHAFFNETRPAYDPAAAALAWERTLTFLRAALAPALH